MALAQVERLRRGDVDSATLDKAKNYIIGLYPLRLETADDVAEALLQLEYYGQPKSWIEEYARQIEAVTMADLRAAAEKHFAYDDLLILVVSNPADVEEQLAAYGPVEIIPPE